MVTVSQKDFLSPGSSIWITCWEDPSPWSNRLDGLLNYIPKKFESYPLNTFIDQFKKKLSEENFNSYFYKTASSKEQKPLILVPQQRLPTSYVVFLKSWSDFNQLNLTDMNLQDPSLRFFGTPPESLFTSHLTNNFKIEIVES